MDRLRWVAHHQRRFLVIVVAAALAASGCATSVSRNPTPETLVDPLGLSDLSEIRHWGDLDSPHTRKWLATPADVIAERFSGIVGTEHHYLCISGGGAEGAFGAGLLVGWTESGTRPEFTFVTGVSTGALTAPFAFLGPSYDAKLEEMYTSYSTGDLLEKRGLFRVLKLMSITRRSISTLIRTQGVGDLYRLFVLADRDGIDYNLAFIPDTFHEKPAEQFDKVYMGKLFELGFEAARQGFAWRKLPPGYELG